MMQAERARRARQTRRDRPGAGAGPGVTQVRRRCAFALIDLGVHLLAGAK
jgi:hypothetical protein